MKTVKTSIVIKHNYECIAIVDELVNKLTRTLDGANIRNIEYIVTNHEIEYEFIGDFSGLFEAYYDAKSDSIIVEYNKFDKYFPLEKLYNEFECIDVDGVKCIKFDYNKEDDDECTIVVFNKYPIVDCEKNPMELSHLRELLN